MSGDRGNEVANAQPTKDFFISRLTIDISLRDAIADLVDNSVDGARRLRAGGSYDGLWVRMQIDGNQFLINDNCGGIPFETARDYAFRFGRPSTAPAMAHSVGHFGVGMKRALFKLGNVFRVESRAERSRFLIEEDVRIWKDQPAWTFAFRELETNIDNPEDSRGTTITVRDLHASVASDLSLGKFLTDLALQLGTKHQDSIDKNLAITVNGIPVQIRLATLLSSDVIKPAYKRIVQESPQGDQVTVRMYAGISTSDPHRAGWYVFCNGRLVLDADQTPRTGWGEIGETGIPKYHNQYARFRGYVFFDSDLAGLLPWNTTKTGVDEDSPGFRQVRAEMVMLMRPVIDFLNLVKEETDQTETEQRPIREAIEAAESDSVVSVSRLNVNEGLFQWNLESSRTHQRQDTVRLTYTRPTDQVEAVRESLGVRSNKEIGERTFDYYYRLECSD